VRDDGSPGPDSNIRLRNVAVCKELTERHGLYFAAGKEQVREHRLREPDKTKYEIYNAIRGALPGCKSWSDLERRLSRQDVGLEFKYKGNTGIREGVRFIKGQYSFSGSKIDQRFSFSKLNAHFNRAQRAEQAPARQAQSPFSAQSRSNLQKAVGGFMAAVAGLFGGSVSGGGADGGGKIDLSPFGGGRLSIPKNDLGIGITAAQLQRQPDETPEQHIARITALINSVTAAMIAHVEEQKRKQQQQVKRSKIKM
jgi:hypothetical protein